MMFSPQQIISALNNTDFDVIAAQTKMAPGPRRPSRPSNLVGRPRQGAVLILLYEHLTDLRLVLTKRPDTLKDHGGQISFPGGKREKNETFSQTALRESWEELGILPDSVDILGELKRVYIPPTDFEVHPFVGWHRGQPAFQPSEYEVAEVIEVSVKHLLSPVAYRKEVWDFRGTDIAIPFYQVNEHKVWGATAVMLAELLGRLEQFVIV